MSLTRGLFLDAANQVGGAMPGVATLHDWSREKNDGAMTGVTWAQTAAGLWVMEFDGGDFATIPESPSLQAIGLTYMTFSFWLFPQLLDATNRPLFANGGQQYQVNIQANTALIYLRIGGVGDGTPDTTTLVVDTWYKVDIVWEIGVRINYYINGTLSSSPAWAGNPTAITGNLTFHLPPRPTTMNGRWKFRNYGLSPAQIRATYHSEKWLFGVAS